MQGLIWEVNQWKERKNSQYIKSLFSSIGVLLIGGNQAKKDLLLPFIYHNVSL
jgi:hypothetical protein